MTQICAQLELLEGTPILCSIHKLPSECSETISIHASPVLDILFPPSRVCVVAARILHDTVTVFGTR